MHTTLRVKKAINHSYLHVYTDRTRSLAVILQLSDDLGLTAAGMLTWSVKFMVLDVLPIYFINISHSVTPLGNLGCNFNQRQSDLPCFHSPVQIQDFLTFWGFTSSNWLWFLSGNPTSNYAKKTRWDQHTLTPKSLPPPDWWHWQESGHGSWCPQLETAHKNSRRIILVKEGGF